MIISQVEDYFKKRKSPRLLKAVWGALTGATRHLRGGAAGRGSGVVDDGQNQIIIRQRGVPSGVDRNHSQPFQRVRFSPRFLETGPRHNSATQVNVLVGIIAYPPTPSSTLLDCPDN